MSAFDDYFARMMPDVEAWFAEHAAEPVVARSVVVPEGEPLNPSPDGFLVPFTSDELLGAVRKLYAYEEAPDELLMDCGVIPDTRPKPPPPSWRTRLRWKRGDWREQTARRAYKVIAGYWPDGGEDDW